MKKLMIAAAIVCAVAVSQASVFNWTFSENLWTGDAYQTPGAQDLTGYKMYIFDTATWGAQETITADTFLLALDGATPISAKLDDMGDGWVMTQFSAKGTGIDAPSGKSEGDKLDLMYVIVNADESKYQALAGQSAADVYNAGGQTVPTAAMFDIDDSAMDASGFFTTAGMKDVQSSIPEPTSGLLLLIGVAGLALKRKRA